MLREDGNTFIIAEIGINHNGDLNIAKKLIDMSKEVGCDAVKFQKRDLDIVYTKEVLDTPRESPWGTTTRQQKQGLEFGKKEYDVIDAYCKEKKIPWFASAWDLESQKFLRPYNLKYNKIASAMLPYTPLLEVVVAERKHTFVSTGMSTWADIDKAVAIFSKHQCPFTLMHAVANYPCEDNECNLLMIRSLRDRYGCEVGYSGHDKGVLGATLAVALGATVVEKHVTLDRTMYGTDQSASLEPRGMELVVRDCRAVRSAFGTSEKSISEKEKGVAKKLRYFEAMSVGQSKA
jgi:N-acetylneuraminate synthase